VTICTDHAAVKAVIGTPNLTGKLCGSGIGEIDIMH